jgi:hypothetical protein
MSTNTPTQSTPPGWYPDPGVPGTKRYWDGSRWTSRIERSKPRLPKMNGLSLTWAYLGSFGVPLIGYVAGVMAMRRGQGVHATAFFIVATINFVASLSALSASGGY